MTAVTPSPTTWTLRIKTHKTTVLLHVEPLSTFDNIKALFLNALKDSPLKHVETGRDVPLPESPSDIQLGRPVDKNDPQAGFVLGEWEQSSKEPQEDVKGKGKGSANQKSDPNLAAPSNIQNCPQGAGLKDGAVLAARWKGDGSAWGSEPAKEDEEEDEEDEEVDEEPSMWTVKIASFEDAYGVENQGDVGGGGNTMDE